ncbi:hypothetical protein DICVIV_06322 [Dictyocaulus viviparus]|uniref:Uncharacterized protein n=1 Tax=Dictyocaulus viviparus TaxID=29172 RepID=A0A0D8XYY8_DICVI|nr:hypothetical protein DICVIV_06322 [Dictyocaulus viviparus]
MYHVIIGKVYHLKSGIIKSSALKAYVTNVNELYSNPLIEQCTKTKLMNDNYGREEMEKLTDDPKVTEKCDHEQLVTRLRDAATKITEWSYSAERENSNARNKEVTLAEMSAMYRLKTLISISAGLVDVIIRAKTWTKENVMVMLYKIFRNQLRLSLQSPQTYQF